MALIAGAWKSLSLVESQARGIRSRATTVHVLALQFPLLPTFINASISSASPAISRTRSPPTLLPPAELRPKQERNLSKASRSWFGADSEQNSARQRSSLIRSRHPQRTSSGSADRVRRERICSLGGSVFGLSATNGRRRFLCARRRAPVAAEHCGTATTLRVSVTGPRQRVSSLEHQLSHTVRSNKTLPTSRSPYLWGSPEATAAYPVGPALELI